MNVDPKVEAAVEGLGTMRIAELRALWHAEFKSEPPKAFGPDLLRRSIAYKIQEDAYGGLDTATVSLFRHLVAQSASAPGKIAVPRRIRPGAVLVREWKGESHRVTVLEDGYGYQGKTYESLSIIARQITGTRWNGPRFFGLRNARDPS